MPAMVTIRGYPPFGATNHPDPSASMSISPSSSVRIVGTPWA